MPTVSFSPRALTLSVVAATTLLASAPQAYGEDTPKISFSANAALVSDYRFRGISLSDKDFALQGGFDITSETGFYVGTWGSSIEQFEGAELELDFYGGYATNFSELDFDIGILAYTYPGSDDTTYWEAYTSIGGSMGTVGWTLGTAYAFDQESIGDDDNIYVYLDTSAPLGDSSFSATTHIAHEDGAFGSNKWDWSIGLSYNHEKFSLGVAYVDTDLETNEGEGGVVVSLSSAF